MQAIAAAVRRLDAAYVVYCQGRDRDLAAVTLDTEILEAERPLGLTGRRVEQP